jgi:probable blue pigment (indigoidine) exporter
LSDKINGKRPGNECGSSLDKPDSVTRLAACIQFKTVRSVAIANWHPPVTMIGWVALIGSSIAMAIAVLMIFVSTARIGPFRTALFMNFEPLLATIGSAIFLGEVITPVQALGGAVMIAALVAFQMRR